MRTRFGALAVTLMAGCAAPSVPYTDVRQAQVRPAAATDVERCTYVDDIVGSSGWYGMFATQGIENARAEALAKAAKVGATHIVWQQPVVVYGSTSVAGKAYRCNS